MGIIDLLNKDITQQELLNYYNANITYIKLPKFFYGLVFGYRGIYNIYINENLSYYKKKKTILHELAHIELNHLEQLNDELLSYKIEFCEDEADSYIKMLTYLNIHKKDNEQKLMIISEHYDETNIWTSFD